jgi:hypothetical protein
MGKHLGLGWESIWGWRCGGRDAKPFRMRVCGEHFSLLCIINSLGGEEMVKTSIVRETTETTKTNENRRYTFK